jgi:hypothetical protein
VGQFIVLPGVFERVMQVVFRRTHARLTEKQVLVLSQRVTRAFVALRMVQGAPRVLLLPAHKEWDVFAHSELGRYYCMGTAIYYVFDCVLLLTQKSYAVDMWIHHLLAIGTFSLFAYSGIGEQGGMLTLLCEALVPWGFLLFYFKLSKFKHIICHCFFLTLYLCR